MTCTLFVGIRNGSLISIDRVPLAKQRANVLGSVCLSVSVFVRLRVLSCLQSAEKGHLGAKDDCYQSNELGL